MSAATIKAFNINILFRLHLCTSHEHKEPKAKFPKPKEPTVIPVCRLLSPNFSMNIGIMGM